METYNLLNISQNKNSAEIFTQIQSGFDDLYNGKGNIIEKIDNKEKKISQIKDDLYYIIYGDLYKKMQKEEKMLKCKTKINQVIN